MTIPTGGVELGSAYGLVGMKFDDRQANNELNRIDQVIARQLNNISGRFQRLGSDLSVGLAPITAFVGGGVLAFMQFDDILTEIEARTGATADQMELVRQKALQMGQDTAFSATDASQAILELLSSGYGLEEAFATLEPTLNAAAAGGLGLGEAADAVTDILAQFQLGAENAEEVVNALSAASSSSSATMRDMVAAFSNVGPVAANYGLSVEQAAAAIAIFAENGIKGAEAGTQLKSMLNNMTRDTEDVVGMWNDLGISMYDAQGQARPLNDVIRDLNVAMADMSDEERNNVIRTLAGSYGQMGLSALLAADGIEGMQAAMQGQADAAVVAQARMNSFKGVVNQLKSTLTTLSINVIGPMVDQYLKPLVMSLVENLNALNALIVGNEQFAAVLGLVLTFLGGIGPVFLILSKVFAGLAAVASIVGGALSLIAGPIGLLIALGIALHAAYKKNFLGIGDFVDRVADAFGSLSSGVKRTFKLLQGGENVFVALRNGIGFFIDDIARKLGIPADKAKALQHAFQDMVMQIQPALYRLVNLVAKVVGFVGNELGRIWEALKTGDASQFMPAIEEAFNNITAAIDRYAPIIAAKMLTFATVFVEWATPIAAQLIGKLATVLMGIGEWIVANAPVIAAYLLKWASAFADWAKDIFFTKILPWVSSALNSLIGWIGNNAPVIAAKLFEWATAFAGWAVNIFWTKILPLLLTLGSQLTGWIVSQIPVINRNILLWAGEFVNWLTDFFIMTMLPKLNQFMTSLGIWILEQVPGLAALIAGWAGSFVNWILETAVPALIGALPIIWATIQSFISRTALLVLIHVGQWANNFIKWIATAISSLPGKIEEFWTSLKGEIEGIATKVFSEAQTIGTEIINGIKQGIDSNLSTVISTLTGLAREAINTVLQELGIASPSKVFAEAGMWAGQGLAEGAAGQAGAVTNAVGTMVSGVEGAFNSIFDRNSPSKLFQKAGQDLMAGLNLGIGGDMPESIRLFHSMASQMQQPLQPVMLGSAAGVGGGGSSAMASNNTYYLTIEVTPPADVFDKNPAQAKQAGAAYGEGLTEQLQAALRNQE